MRVLWVSHRGRLGGGATLCLAEGVSALAERGHEVHVVLPEEGNLAERLAHAASVRVVYSAWWMSHGLSRWVKLKRAWVNVRRASPALGRLARDLQVDVIVTNTLTLPAPALAARRVGLPHVWFIHEFGDPAHGLEFDWGREFTLRAVARLSHAVLVNSRAVQRHFSRWISPAKMHLAHYAVEVAEIPAVEREPGGPLRILLLGRRSPQKGAEDAVHALGHLRRRGIQAVLELVGDGTPWYDRRLAELADRVASRELVRMVPFDPEPYRWLAAADVVLMCSRQEAFGRVTVEAMKLGRPVVGASSGGTTELIDPGRTGLLYTPGNAAELADRVEALYGDPALRRELGENARRWAVEHFTRRRYGEDLERALRCALDSKPGTHRAT